MVAVAVPVAVSVLLADVVFSHWRAVPANDTRAVLAGHARLERDQRQLSGGGSLRRKDNFRSEAILQRR